MVIASDPTAGVAKVFVRFNDPTEAEAAKQSLDKRLVRPLSEFHSRDSIELFNPFNYAFAARFSYEHVKMCESVNI